MKTTKKFNVLGPVATDFGAATTGNWRLERPQVDFASCIKCRTCEKYCPTNVIEIKKDQEECVVIDFDYCKGCGICTNVCPQKCIVLVEERR
ncbi:MAG: 4Fe-4S binding protein [Christensenellales bacterium]